MKKVYNTKKLRINQGEGGSYQSEESKKPTIDVDPGLYNERSLNLLTIHDLREIGRKFGVPSPTTLSKNELIEYILNIVYGKVEVKARKNTLGRPTNREFNIQNYIDRIQKSILPKFDESNLYTSFAEMKVSSPVSEYASSMGKIETRVLCDVDGKFKLRVSAYIESSNDIDISKEMVKKFNLEPFDVLEIIANGGLVKIVTINGKRVKDSFSGLQISGNKVFSGTNKIFYMPSKEETKNNIEIVCSVCEVNEVPLLLFCKNSYSGKTVHQIMYSEEDDGSKRYKKFMMFLGECEKITAESGDMVLLVEDWHDVLEAIESFDADVVFRIKQNVKEELLKFSKLGNVCLLLSSEVSSLY